MNVCVHNNMSAIISSERWECLMYLHVIRHTLHVCAHDNPCVVWPFVQCHNRADPGGQFWETTEHWRDTQQFGDGHRGHSKVGHILRS